MHTGTEVHQQIEFIEQLRTVSAELADWASNEIASGRNLPAIRQQLLRVMKIVTPLREAEQPPHDNVFRSDREFNLNWATENPHLFVQSVRAFQQNHPVTHWAHYVDLSREHFVKLGAVRRQTPYESLMDYVTSEDMVYLREIGYAV